MSRAFAGVVLAACALAVACGKDGTLELRIVTPPGQDPFVGATTARLTLGTSPPSVTTYAIQSDGTVNGALKNAPKDVAATVTIELLDSSAKVLARGATPPIPLSNQLSGYVEVLVGRVAQFAAIPTALPVSVRRPTVVGVSASEILVAGGAAASGPSAQAEIYNLYDFSFEQAGDLVTPRLGAAAVTGTGGKLFLHGGLVPNTPAPWPTETVEVFDASSRAFTGAQGGGGARSGAVASPFPDSPDRWLVSGGLGPLGTALATALVFDQSASTFTTLSASMGAARAGHSSIGVQTASGPRVFLFGGSANGPVAELFDPTTRAFAPLATPAALTARSDQSATLLADGRVLVAGGKDPSGAATSELWLYDPSCADGSCASFALATESAGTPLQLATPRSGHAAFALASGRVLLAGGRGAAGVVLGTAEVLVYDTTTHRFTRESAPNLNVPRAEMGAALLSTGQVLLVGGVDQNGTPLGTAELFIPR